MLYMIVFSQHETFATHLISEISEIQHKNMLSGI